jgi:Calcineurin-like phosphoesterase
MPGRSIVVGDVHGCLLELDDLLKKVAFDISVDSLYLVGDVLARGPDSRGVLSRIRDCRGRFVRGNHEERLLAARKDTKVKLSTSHRELLESLRPDEWEQIEEAPLWLDLPEHQLRLVHAGLDPQIEQMGAQERSLVLNVRTLRDETGVEYLWAERYTGPVHIAFGHHAMRGLQVHPYATGLDTGCVYGNRLTALVLDETGTGRLARTPELRDTQLVSVPAKRIWFDPKA